MYVENNFMVNGRLQGPMGQRYGDMMFDPFRLQPFMDVDRNGHETGHKCVLINTGKIRKDKEGNVIYNKDGMAVPVLEKVRVGELTLAGQHMEIYNAGTSMRLDDWRRMEDRVIKAARKRMRAWTDLARESTYTLDGMGTMVLEHETMSDPGEAIVSMEAATEGRADSPLFQAEGTPLPITFSDYWYDERHLAVSRRRGEGLTSISSESAGRRIGESIEKTTIGIITGARYGNAALYGRNPQVYGYLTFPDRIVQTDLVAPTGSNGAAVLDDFLRRREALYDANFTGPYVVYVSPNWDRYLDQKFSSTEPSAGTLRQALEGVSGVGSIRRLDYLTGTNYQQIWVQMDPDVARAVIGLPITVVRWDSMGGLRKNFRVMTIQVPQMFADHYGNTGILTATN